MFTIKSIFARVHDTGFGGYPYKVIVTVDVDAKTFAKLPVIRKAQQTICGRKDAVRDLGSLVLGVNNAVYKLNPNIPSHNPSIDSSGGSRARNGIKTMEFVYFFRDHSRARALGFEFFGDKVKHSDGSPCVKSFQSFEIKVGA